MTEESTEQVSLYSICHTSSVHVDATPPQLQGQGLLRDMLRDLERSVCRGQSAFTLHAELQPTHCEDLRSPLLSVLKAACHWY